jgi:hypothetical protein
MLQVVPWGLRKELNYIAKQYNNPPLIITENGFSDHGGLQDTDRVHYYTVSTWLISFCGLSACCCWQLAPITPLQVDTLLL